MTEDEARQFLEGWALALELGRRSYNRVVAAAIVQVLRGLKQPQINVLAGLFNLSTADMAAFIAGLIVDFEEADTLFGNGGVKADKMIAMLRRLESRRLFLDLIARWAS
jgi:hypothetical protein